MCLLHLLSLGYFYPGYTHFLRQRYTAILLSQCLYLHILSPPFLILIRISLIIFEARLNIHISFWRSGHNLWVILLIFFQYSCRNL